MKRFLTTVLTVFLGVLSLNCSGSNVGNGPVGNDVIQTDIADESGPEVQTDTTIETGHDVVKNDTAVETTLDTTPTCHNDLECDDDNVCTNDHCQWGICYHEAFDCGDGKACYESEIGQRACAYTCHVDDDCVSLNQCYDAYCQNGFCQFSPNNGRECDDNDPCRDDECVFGTCVKQVKGECCSLTTDTCTDDNNPCTSAACIENSCAFVADNNATCDVGGRPGKCYSGYCWNDTPAGFCFDNNSCTDDAQNLEHTECIHNLVCADGDFCTVDLCIDQPNGLGFDHTCLFQKKQNCCHTDVDCNDSDPCTKDRCNGTTCEHDKLCLDGEPKMLTCEYDSDCTGTGFGDYCVASGEPGTPLKLCQECTGGGEQNECLPWEMCFWGIGGNGSSMYSVFWCEATVCETAEDCNDNDPCTTDFCGLTECFHNPKEYCTHCTDDNDCIVQSWCDNSGGGVLIQYANCETTGACQIDSWDSTVDVTLYDCEYPIECDSDADCPRIGGECVLGTCYYYDAETYPECAVDSDCFGIGACDFAAGKCNAYECYAIDNGEGSVSVKLCPANQTCVDNKCQPDIIVTTGCTKDSDCLAMGLGGYCNADLVTGEMGCYACSPYKYNDNPLGVDIGCSVLNAPYCAWNDMTDNYGCVECTGDSQCGFGTVCLSNTCVQTDDIVCQVVCPVATPAWTEAVIWYGDNLDATVNCGASFAMTQASLCEWGTKNPEFKMNLTDGVWKWGGGVDVTLICNYGAWIRPDPTPSGTPGETMGDLGVAIVDFETILCSN